MAHGPARINSPEVLKDFRHHLIKFNESCQQAVAGMKTDVFRVQQWLLGEQLNHWKREVQRAEERVLQARHEYNEARFGTPALRKESFIDELKALRRAEARREEARNKIQKIKRWSSTIDQQAQKMMGPINQLNLTLDTETPKALARLESMIQNLEDYLRSLPPDAGV